MASEIMRLGWVSVNGSHYLVGLGPNGAGPDG